MKCIDSKYIAVPPGDGAKFFNWKKFETIPTLTNYTLAPIATSMEIFDKFDDVVYMLYDEPNGFWAPDQEKTIYKNYNKIKKLITACPYTTKYYNDLYGNDKRTPAFLPWNIENIPVDFTKKYDVYFTGHVMHEFVTGFVNIIEKFNNSIVSYNYGRFRNVGFHEKLQLNANSKISVVHNCLFDTSGFPMDERFPKNEVFKNWKKSRFMPQFKSRTNEAAACKSVMLAHFEEFKCIEEQFIPDLDFIYWYNTNDLEEKINEILKNYDKYIHIAEHAHQTLLNNWTTYHFFEKYLRNL